MTERRELKHSERTGLHNPEIEEIEAFLEFSKSQLKSPDEVLFQFPTFDARLNTADFLYIAPDNRKVVTFKPAGTNGLVKTREEHYRRILTSGKPHHFDITHWTTYEYDDKHYLVRVKDMHLGKLGHVYDYSYADLPGGRRALHSVTGHERGKQGVISMGPAIGESATVTFDHLHDKTEMELRKKLAELEKNVSLNRGS